jgi:clan AA aspartic protease
MRLKGWVDDQLSPRIKISITRGKELDIVVDSGFNGEIMLPKRHLKKLGFEYRGWTLVELADGSKVPSAFYEGSVLWFGQKRKVRVHPTKSEDALLGTQMLIGYVFELDIEGDRVIIKKKNAAKAKSV